MNSVNVHAVESFLFERSHQRDRIRLWYLELGWSQYYEQVLPSFPLLLKAWLFSTESNEILVPDILIEKDG